MFSIFTLLIGLHSLPSLAQGIEDCPSVDLENPGESLANVPVWNQGSSEYCYVYSASTLASAWMHAEWSKLNSAYATQLSIPNDNIHQILADPKARIETLNADLGRTCESLEFILANERIDPKGPARSSYPLPHCASWGIDPSADGSHKVQAPPEAFESKMHALLTSSAHPLPFGIEYCSGVYFNPKATLITQRTYHPDLNYLNDPVLSKENFQEDPGQTVCSFHTAVVIGQEKRNGLCYFKLRNSKGTKELPFRHNPGFDRGDNWIEASALSRNILRLEVLSSP